jgi:hypothetical protein
MCCESTQVLISALCLDAAAGATFVAAAAAAAACCLQVKGLAHPGHWSGPLGPFFEQFGAVKAGPMTAFKLLKDGEQV